MQDASPIKAGLTLLTIFVGNLCHFIDSFAHIVYTNFKKKKGFVQSNHHKRFGLIPE